jgi:hypothetical protein
MTDKKLLEEMGADVCPAGKYCFLKEMTNYSPLIKEYMLLQLKMIDKFKYTWHLGWDDASMRFGTNGLAKQYSILYTGIENRHVDVMYNKLLEWAKENKK